MYYKIPFDFSIVMDKDNAQTQQNLPTCSLPESISQHLHTLIVTRQGENRYDPDYGNKIWDLEFSNALSEARWNEAFSDSIANIVETYEKRLTDAKIDIHSEMVEKTWPMRAFTEVKRKVTIIIKAVLSDTGQDYSFKTDLFLSPMSVD